jgi:cytoskeletal protein RodZ
LYIYFCKFVYPSTLIIMKLILACAGALLLAPLVGSAQTKPAPAAKAPVAKPAAAKVPAAAATSATPASATATAPAPIALAPVTPAADPNALKIKTDINPISHKLTVRCDAVGPTRIEINDKEGRPVLTKNTMAGTTPVMLDVTTLPAGPYVVRCTAGDKTGMRRVMLGE